MYSDLINFALWCTNGEPVRACAGSRASIAPPRIHALLNSERVTGNSRVNVNCCNQAISRFDLSMSDIEIFQ